MLDLLDDDEKEWFIKSDNEWMAEYDEYLLGWSEAIIDKEVADGNMTEEEGAAAKKRLSKKRLGSISDELSAGQKAALTRGRRAAGNKAAQTRKRMNAWTRAHAAEAASKEALRLYCKEHGWRVAFFEGATGAPRTGIIDAIAFRLGRKNSDLLDVRLIQLKGGNAGVTGKEVARLKDAAAGATVNWLIAEYDGETLHLLPNDPIA